MTGKSFPKTHKGRLLRLLQGVINWWQGSKRQKLPHYTYSVRYMNCVDDECYEFICKNSKDNLFLMPQQALNWELHYPGNISSPLSEKVPVDGKFFQNIPSLYQNYFVQVKKKDKIAGVYLLRHCDNEISMEYIYYAKEFSDIVFSSVVEHIHRLNSKSFSTEDKELSKFVQKYIFFPVCKTENLSLSISPEIEVPNLFIR